MAKQTVGMQIGARSGSANERLRVCRRSAGTLRHWSGWAGMCLAICLHRAAEGWQIQSDTTATTILAARVERAPEIDGDLADWPESSFSIRLDSRHLNHNVRYSPPIAGGDADCSGVVALSWDDEFLFVAARIRDDERSALNGRAYGAPWGHDGLNVYLHAPAGLQLTGRYGKEYRRDSIDRSVLLGINYHEPGAEPRDLPGRSRYAVRDLPDGYALEAAVEWRSLGYHEVRAGDRLKMGLILVDVDPGAPPQEAFGQILWHIGERGSREFSGWADLRLVDDGWGGEAVALVLEGGDSVGIQVSLDADRDGVAFKGVRIRDMDGVELDSRMLERPAAVRPGERLTASTQWTTQGFPEGTYALSAVTSLDGEERNGGISFPLVLQKQAAGPDLSPLLSVDDPKRFVWRRLPQSNVQDVNKAAYLEFLETHARPKLASLTATFRRPWRHAHSPGFLAAYLHAVTGDELYADCARAALESAMQWAESQDERFDPHAGEHWLMVKFMREGGLIPPDLEPRVQAFLVKSSRMACVGAYGWVARPWRRGAGHSALGPAVSRYYALHFYPDRLTAEERETFRRYYDLTWGDWWTHRDTIYNDTSYRAIFLWDIFVTAYLTGRTDLFADPEALKFWERLLYTVAPSGALPHYGNTNGWSTAMGMYIFFMEYLGAQLQDGRYRAVAHRLFDYLVNHSVNVRDYHFEADKNIQGIALAHMVADDSVTPVSPGGASRVLTRKEIKPLAEAEQEFGFNVYNMDLGPADVPDKIIFNTDDRPESLWAMIDLCPRAGHHEPAAPGNVIALMDYKAVLTCDQGYFDKTPDFHNVVFVEDLAGTAAVADPMEIALQEFYDRDRAAYARLRVDNYQGWPMHAERRFLFARGRFLLVKDTVEFQSAWMCRLGPAWQAQRISPKLGDHWVNVYVDSLFVTGLGLGRGMHRWINPAQDLLIYHLPQEDCYLEVLNRFEEQPYRQLPIRVRYVWKGMARAGDVRHFTTLLLPHPPAPSPENVAARVQVLADSPERTAIVVATQENREEWVLLNEGGHLFEGGGIETDARQLYLFVDAGRRPERYVMAEGASFVRLHGENVAVPAADGRLEGAF